MFGLTRRDLRLKAKSIFAMLLLPHRRLAKIQCNITTSLIVSLSEAGFGLDELVYRMEDLANKKAFPELLRTIILVVDENIWLKVMLRQPLPVKCGCTCERPDPVLDGSMPRKIRTRLGLVDLPRITRVKCRHCGKTFVPLTLMCGLEKHQTMSNELEKLVLEQCAQESYRVATGNIHEMTAARECHSTFRRWVLKTDADEIRVPEDTMGAVPGVLYADGTKCKSIGSDGHACKGDVKVLLGVRDEGTVFPIGTWTGHETWQDISDQLTERQVRFPDGTILVCDGEIGLAESLSKLASDEQRCQWHVHRDLYHMMRANGGRIKDVRPMQERLRGIMAIELPKESFAQVSEEQKASIRAKMEQAEQDLDALVGDIRNKGYTVAVNHLERAKHAMFGYVRRWLALGLVCPRASSFIERTMMRLIQRKVREAEICEWDDGDLRWSYGMSGARLSKALASWQVLRHPGDIYQMLAPTESDTRRVLSALGVNLKPKMYTKGELIGLKASVKPF